MAAAGSSSYSDTTVGSDKETVVIDVPRKKLSNIIGSSSKGEHLEHLKEKSGASIEIIFSDDGTSKVEVSGNKEQVYEAVKLIREAIAETYSKILPEGPFPPPMQIPRDL